MVEFADIIKPAPVDDDESRVSISNGEIYIASSDYFSRAHKALRIEAREGVGRIVAMANAAPDLLAEVHRLRAEVGRLNAGLSELDLERDTAREEAREASR